MIWLRVDFCVVCHVSQTPGCGGVMFHTNTRLNFSLAVYVQVAIFYDVLPPFVSVHLARRVLQLEKINTSVRQEVEREKKKVLQLAEEVR